MVTAKSRVYDVYPKFGSIKYYKKLSDEDLISIIRRLCTKYVHVRKKFEQMDRELAYLKRRNEMLENRFYIMKHTLHDFPTFKSPKKKVKRIKETNDKSNKS